MNPIAPPPSGSNAAGLMFQTWPQRTLAAPWMSGPNADRYVSVLELMRDCLLEKAVEAVTIHLPGQGDLSQLPYLAHDRQLSQGPAETNAAFVIRLREAFQTWQLAGSRVAVMLALQSYLSGLQPGVTSGTPEIAIVGGNLVGAGSYAQWDTLANGSAIGAAPVKTIVKPANLDWDGQSRSWRAWCVLYMSQVATTLSGTAAQTGTAAAGSLYASGGSAGNHTWGHLVNGVWVPNTTGTAVNSPWLTVTGLSGLSSAQVGQWLSLSGSAYAGNNGTFPIVSVASPSSCVIANPQGTASDTGPLTWSVGYYPFLAPAPVWGAPGYVFGQALQYPPVDTGSNIQGVWQPTLGGPAPNNAWGIAMQPTVVNPPPPTSFVVSGIRALLKQWKSARTFYDSIVIVFDGGTGAPGGAWSPLSSKVSGNPNGTFGGYGKLVNLSYAGIIVPTWVPNRGISSNFDCYATGTGSSSGCTVFNVT